MLTFRHYAVAVHDLDEAVRNHTARFGMQPTAERGFNAIGKFHQVPMGYDGKMTILLISPDQAEETPLSRLMKERANPLNPHGEGLYLVGFDCDDVAGFCDQVEQNGGKVNRTPDNSIAWIHPTASNFVFMELFQTK